MDWLFGSRVSEWAIKSLITTAIVCGVVYALTYSYFDSRPKYFSHQTLLRAGSDEVPEGLPGSKSASQLSKAGLRVKTKRLSSEAVAYLDFKYEGSKALINAVWADLPPQAMLRSVSEDRDAEDYLVFETWGTSPEKAKEKNIEVLNSLREQFDPRAIAAKKSLSELVGVYSSMLKDSEKTLKELDKTQDKIGYNDLITKQKAYTREEMYRIQRDLASVETALELNAVRTFEVVSEKTSPEPVFPAPFLSAVIASLISLFVCFIVAILVYPSGGSSSGSRVAVSQPFYSSSSKK